MFGWGIVSTGKHPDVKIAPAMAAADGGELVGVYSRDQHRAEAFAQKHDARVAYSQLGDLLKDSRVDGVFVASPNALHAEHVVQAAEAGKHVLCEKPMATTIPDAVRMLKACRRAGVTLGVAFNLRQHPAYIRARPLEQLACLTLRFGNGTLGQVVASRLLPDSRNDFRVYGITGLIAGHHSMWEARTGRFEITSDTINETTDYPEALLPNYVAEVEDFQRAVATHGQPAATGLDGLRVVEVTLAMIESARTRRSVKIERVEP